MQRITQTLKKGQRRSGVPLTIQCDNNRTGPDQTNGEEKEKAPAATNTRRFESQQVRPSSGSSQVSPTPPEPQKGDFSY
jgi:hypothetical protein